MAPAVTIVTMGSFAGKLAVVTGSGSGMGRELPRQLAAQGCSVAARDLNRRPAFTCSDDPASPAVHIC
jgi:NAD(P)-dependent dehydrogenase (short-subunit alcohol dehydrogenase family)